MSVIQTVIVVTRRFLLVFFFMKTISNASPNFVFFLFIISICVYIFFVTQASGAKASVGDRPHFLYGAHQRPHSGRIDVVPRQSSRCGGVVENISNTYYLISSFFQKRIRISSEVCILRIRISQFLPNFDIFWKFAFGFDDFSTVVFKL